MKIHITSRGLDLTTDLEKYANRKLARLAKKVPRRKRAEAVCKIVFAQVRRRGKEINTCSIDFVFNSTQLRAQETTLHMYAALDIAAVHMERQIIDFAAQHRRPLRAQVRRLFRRER